jgi:dolichol-phosphate mannosyltransferase
MKTLVVIPTYNEALTVSQTISEVLALEPEISILVVDDNSPDGTANMVENIANNEPRVSLLARPSKKGLGLAYLAGFQWGFDRNFDLIVEMDADGSHRAIDLPSLLKAATDADLVIGSRWIAGGQVLNWPNHRRFVSRFGNRYAKFMLGTNIYDITSGFRVYRASFLKQLVGRSISSHGYAFQVELAYRAASAGVVAEMPITFVERVNGKSKMTLAIVLEALTKVTFWGLKRIFAR